MSVFFPLSFPLKKVTSTQHYLQQKKQKSAKHNLNKTSPAVTATVCVNNERVVNTCHLSYNPKAFTCIRDFSLPAKSFCMQQLLWQHWQVISPQLSFSNCAVKAGNSRIMEKTHQPLYPQRCLTIRGLMGSRSKLAMLVVDFVLDNGAVTSVAPVLQ